MTEHEVACSDVELAIAGMVIAAANTPLEPSASYYHCRDIAAVQFMREAGRRGWPRWPQFTFPR